MTCSHRPPRICSRTADTIAEALSSNRRGYLPEWTTLRGSGDAGVAVNEILARYLSIQCEGLNAMPQRLQLEFLESLGASVLPAHAARAPLVFTLLENASGDATVPRGTRVAAVLPPPTPSLEDDQPPRRAAAPEFFTEQEITAMRGRLSVVYSIDPQADTFADHSTPGSVSIFDTRQQVPHRLYLGDRELFKLNGSAQIVLSFDFAQSRGAATQAPRPLLLDWEYLSTDGWQPLVVVEDTTQRFTRDGKITLGKFFGPDSKEDAIAGRVSCWIRGAVSSRTPRARITVESAGYLVRFAPAGPAPPLAVGDEVKVAGGGAAARVRVVGIAPEEIILESPLPGAAPGIALQTVTSATIGTIVTAPPHFRIPVESARDLLPGDVITVDGMQRAIVAQTAETALYLRARIANAQPGGIVELADALPPLRPDGADEQGVLPSVDVIRARVGLGQDDLPLDSAYLDSARLDTSKDFFPFGTQPERFAAWYLACDQAFSRGGARIDVHLTYVQTGNPATGAAVEAEYFNGQRWTALGANEEYEDGSDSLTKGTTTGGGTIASATISFVAPSDWTKTEQNGEEQLWLRFRLAAGHYGRPLTLAAVADPAVPGKLVVSATQPDLRPPIIARAGVSFRYFTNPQPLEFCIGENDFAFEDHSEAARWPRSGFAPFTPILDLTPAVHFGFTSKPPSAAVSILAHVLEPATEGSPQPYVWDYWSSRGWTELSVRDMTSGLMRTGLIQFVGAPDAIPRDGLGGALYRIRARLKSGLTSHGQIVRVGGFWLNAVWARQGQSIEKDRLGVSNGDPDQTFVLPIVRGAKAAAADAPPRTGELVADDPDAFDRALMQPLAGVPILDDEVVEVREWIGRGDDWQTVLAGVDLSRVRFEVAAQDPTIKTAAWVRWTPLPHLYDSAPDGRHYVVERARGVFRFPGSGGFVPPAGAPIVVTYVTGGGVDGNVPAGAVRELRSGVGFVQSVTNPLAASGGAATERLYGARDRSAQWIRHRGRAVSFEDFEWLAVSASSEVARARAIPLESLWGRGARGFVGIVIVPHSSEPAPLPSPELTRTVLETLAERAPAGISAGLRTIAPSYRSVGVRAEILPLRIDEAGRVESRVRTRLAAFLHPLSGGRDGRGWQFGESVYLSDLALLIESTPGVDAVRFLQLRAGQTLYGDRVPLEPYELIAAGDSQLKIVLPRVRNAVA